MVGDATSTAVPIAFIVSEPWVRKPPITFPEKRIVPADTSILASHQSCAVCVQIKKSAVAHKVAGM